LASAFLGLLSKRAAWLFIVQNYTKIRLAYGFMHSYTWRLARIENLVKQPDYTWMICENSQKTDDTGDKYSLNGKNIC